jgi:dipeptidyl aminopeptidase/acylaminoacyl peptidase
MAIPRSVLFGHPTRTSPTISPDGTLAGFIAPDDGVLNVWVGPRDGSAEPAPVTHDRRRGVSTYGFCHDDRTLMYLQDADGDENWRVYLLDLPTGRSRCVTPDRVQAKILHHNRWHPDTVLLGLNRRDPALHDVYRLTLSSGALELVERNPGFASWIVDSELSVRGAAEVTEDGGAVLRLRDAASGEYLSWKAIPADDVAGTNVVGFTRDGKTLLLLSPVEANTTRLLAVDVASGAERVVAADPGYDVGGVLQDPDTLEPQAVVIAKDRDEWLWLDDDLRSDVTRLRATLRAEHGIDGDIALDRSERADQIWLVPVAVSDGPTRYFVHDRRSGATRYWFAHRPELEDYPLAAMEPFSFTSRDGLDIHGYLTFPPEMTREQLPAVLLVHGGPRARDSWGFDPEAQWLASRGYVCVQVNYRGSTGYGKAFIRAGNKEWGGRMHDDLVDAVSYCAGQGWIDSARIAIMGASYGGYAALAGVAFTPDVFRCAVDVCGPSNLLTLLDSLPPYWTPMISYMHATVGDPATERDLLWRRSPLSKVDDIRVPVLVVAGKNDPRVSHAESEQIVQALARSGVDHEYLLFEDEGHGLAQPANREVFYATAERFLAQHLS